MGKFSFKSVFKAVVTAAAVAAAVYFGAPYLGFTISGSATAYIASAAIMAGATATVSQLLAETGTEVCDNWSF